MSNQINEELRPKNFIIWIVFFATSSVFLFLDLITKFLARSFLHSEIVLIPNCLKLELVFNKGISFGMFKSMPYFPYAFAIVGSFVIFYLVYIRQKNYILLGMLFGSLLGNFFDRIFSNTQAVTDFIGYFDWFIGNIADIFIIVSVVILSIKYIVNASKESSRDSEIESQEQI